MVKDEQLLQRFREAWRCEWCRMFTPTGCDPHHIFTRGAGRVDLPCNLVSLCRECHGCVHNGLITRDELLTLVAKREQIPVALIEEMVYRARRVRK